MLPRPSTINSQPPSQETKPAVIPVDTQLQPTCKSPLLPTPPAPTRQNIRSTIPRPSTSNNSRKPTFPRPSVLNSNRFHQQPFITRPSPIYNRFHQQPFTPRPFNHQQIPLLPLPSHQIQAFSGPQQQRQGHYTQQVSLPLYVPIVILTPYNQINSVLAHQTNLFNPNQYWWTSRTHEWSKKTILS